jgi:uncharacterized protein
VDRDAVWIGRPALALMMVATLTAARCEHKPATMQPGSTTPVARAPRVLAPGGKAIEVEIAANDETREQGLMYRDRLSPGHGMLFLFARAGIYPFWMKNTIIPLDMIWIDESLRVVHVERNVPPCKADPCPSYDPKAEARYVLELAGGEATPQRIDTGTQLRFENVDVTAAR